jgi:L-ascorbate metabolism protein UlaG (beta-lactamase superfamily)
MVDTKGNTVTYLGHSVFLLKTAAGSVALIDPFLQNPNCPKEFRALEKLDVIFLSHAHGDHLGDEAWSGGGLYFRDRVVAGRQGAGETEQVHG